MFFVSRSSRTALASYFIVGFVSFSRTKDIEGEIHVNDLSGWAGIPRRRSAIAPTTVDRANSDVSW